MRWLLKTLGLLVAIALIAAATLPWWLGGALWLVRHPLDLEVSRYERIGYTRFAVHDVTFHRKNVEVRVARLEADTPLLWLWRHFRTEKSSSVWADGWSVRVRKGDSNRTVPDAGWKKLRALLMKIATQLDLWLPDARVTNGEVQWPRGGLRLAEATWREGTLRVRDLAMMRRVIDGEVKFFQLKDLIQLQAKIRNFGELQLESSGLDLGGALHFWDQPVSLAARFGDTGWLPQEARAAADKWTLPGKALNLDGFYSAIDGRLRFEWQRDSFVLELAAKGRPSPDRPAPPFDLNVNGRGNLDTITIETLRAVLPGINISLSEPVRLNREGELLSGPSRLVLDADLARQPWASAAGRLTGIATVEPRRDQFPRVELAVTAHDARIVQRTVAQFDLSAVLEWPRLAVNGATATFGPKETVRVSGHYDLQQKRVADARIIGEIRGETVAAWWPKAPDFAAAAFDVTADGPVKVLRHGGTATIAGLKFSPVKPFAVEAKWRGTAARFDAIEATALAGATAVKFTGAVAPQEAMIEQLRISKDTTELLALEAPSKIVFSPVLTVGRLRAAGPAGRLDFEGVGGPRGNVHLSAAGLSPELIRDFLPLRGPAWKIESLEFSGNWNAGPMNYAAAASVSTEFRPGWPVVLQLSAKGNGHGIQLEGLRVDERGAAVIAASGSIPIVLKPYSTPAVVTNEDARLKLHVASQPAAAFWEALAGSTGVAVEGLILDAAVEGTLKAPTGTIALSVARVKVDPERLKQKLPPAEAVRARVTLDRGVAVLERLEGKIDGQSVQIDGRLPAPEGGWSKIAEAPVRFLRREGVLRIQIPDADISILAQYAPDLLASKGKFQADVSMNRGALDGFVKLQDAASRPIGPLGALQDLNADVKLDGHKLELSGLEAKMGGQPVTLKGSAELPPDEPLRYEFTLQGKNLPFVRKVGLLLRGDLDLKLASIGNGIGKITGAVNLRDSLFSMDVRDLIPRGGGGGAANRPPFFSVEAKPLNAWQLAVELSGERFLRVRTPLFVGTASVHFRLGGTLGEPRAIGEAVVEEGDVLLPFASFDVRNGSVRLTESNPYEPALFVMGTSRRLGYDLRMEVTGTASTPVISFSSSPPLDSEQVLLLVMAGEPPNNEVSYGTSQRAARLGTFLGKSLLSSIRGNPGDEGRLNISSGERVSRQGRETYQIEYELDEDWSLVGEYDEFDAYNAGIQWRFLTDEPAGGEARNEK